jgi:sugar lactone lactonase YvrE
MKKKALWMYPALTLLLVALAIWSSQGCSSGSSHSVTPPPTNPEYLWVADALNNRILVFNAPFSTGQNASVVLGQADFTSSSQATSATGLNDPTRAIADAQGNAWVSDWGNNRVLEYTQPLTSGMAASLVLGQANFSTSSSSTTANAFSGQHEMAFDSAGNLWVADSFHDRVLEFTPPFSSGMNASLVLGQNSFSTSDCATTASGLCNPTGLSFDANGDLWIADADNDRVLEYKPPFTTGQSAAAVLGQPDFTSMAQGASATGFDGPWSVATDSAGNIWVSDGGNWRVLQFTAPFSNGEAANIVLGFPNFTSNVNSDPQSSLTNPRGIAFDRSGNLFVADNSSSRVMVFAPQFSNGMDASEVIGQPNFDSVQRSTTISGMSEPIGLSVSF